MKINALTIRSITCLTAAWLSVATASAQPNLADLLDKENAAQPRPIAPEVFAAKKLDDTAAFDVDITGAMVIELRVMTEHGDAAWAAWLNPEILF